MKLYRLNRLFNAKSGRCFDVAVDHGFFNEYGFLSGIENLGAAVATLTEAGPDAIQLTVGQSRFLQSLKGRHKQTLVLRTDVANRGEGDNSGPWCYAELAPMSTARPCRARSSAE